MKSKMIVAIVIVVGLTGCYNDKEELLYPSAFDCASQTISFAATIQPIIQTRCAIAGCHDAPSGNKGGPFTNYSLIKNKALIIRAQVSSGVMPQGSSLSANQIALINCWVTQGALNN